MLLLLASEHDETAQRIFNHAQQQGIAVIHGCDIQAFQVCARAQRNTHTNVEIRERHSGALITAILNRGLSQQNAGTAPFGESEIQATWWALLACFSGKVANCPSRFSFIPELSPESFFSLPGILPAHSRIVSGKHALETSLSTNVHRLRDGCHQQRLEAAHTVLELEEPCLVTNFDSNCTFRFLIAGHQLFNLTSNSPFFRQHQATLQAIHAHCLAAHAPFVHAVAESRGSQLAMLSVTSLPFLTHYVAVESAAHAALLDFLQP